MPDLGHGVHYSAVQPGAPVYASDEVEVGKVEVVLDNYEEHIFDGVVFRDQEGELRFADAPEVARTAELGVELRLTAEEARRLGPPDEGPGKFRPDRRAGRLSRLLGRGGWKRQ